MAKGSVEANHTAFFRANPASSRQHITQKGRAPTILRENSCTTCPVVLIINAFERLMHDRMIRPVMYAVACHVPFDVFVELMQDQAGHNTFVAIKPNH